MNLEQVHVVIQLKLEMKGLHLSWFFLPNYIQCKLVRPAGQQK